MHKHEQIDYIEFPSTNLEAAKVFFSVVFGWSFTDYGAEYTAFEAHGLNGGFFKSEKSATVAGGSALIVFYSQNIEATQEKILAAGGKVVRETFAFPGGRRFHFKTPDGNEFAIWSDQGRLED